MAAAGVCARIAGDGAGSQSAVEAPWRDSVAEFRARGYLPEALTNYLALIGWSPGADEEVLPIDELAARFRLEDVGHSAGVFDVEKLAWVNRHYLKAAAPDRLARLALPYLRQAGWVSEPLPATWRIWRASFLSRPHPSIGSSRFRPGCRSCSIIRRLVRSRCIDCSGGARSRWP